MPLRRHAKTAVIPIVFKGSGARFRRRTPQNPKYLVFLLESTKNHQISAILMKFTEFYLILSDFPPCGAPGARIPIIPKEYQRF